MFEHLDTSTLAGLPESEALARLKEAGYNELPSEEPRSVLAIALEVVREPMFMLLVIAGTIYLVLGDLQEALMLLSFVFLIMGITFYQERRTERALEALRDLSSPRALVIRDGIRKRVAGREVVPGDIIILAEGDRVPADAVILSSTSVLVDESLLTGESVPVRKVAWDGVMEMDRPGGNDLPFVYSGTLVVQGQGIARAEATGTDTEIGKIGRALRTVEIERTPLQVETTQLVRRLALLGLSLCLFVVVAYGLTRGNWLDGILAGITLSMAVLPEEFPAILTIFFALGAWRISQKRVLTRRVPVLETLGSATVLCVDKTGTLTLNQMTVEQIFADGQFLHIDVQNCLPGQFPDTFHELVEFSVLASPKDPFNPMERAIVQLGNCCLADTEHLHASWILEREYPLSRELLAVSHVWSYSQGSDYVIAAKGAPEAMADLCHFDETQMRELTAHVDKLANDGLRVLGIARAYFGQEALPGEQHDFDFQFLGLVGLADPVRPAVRESIRECYDAGVRVVMITGDYPGTAQHVARQIGLKPMDEFITGPELSQMDDLELRRRVQRVSIFARVAPEQKLRLVDALKSNGEIVAMTGDGVNDAPALKSAHIGIAMGGRGTDVAREAAALVLLDDDFNSIVQAVRMGRRIFDNLRKAMVYILAIHVPIAGMSLVPVALNLPLVLMPVHVVFLELIIDPACSVVFEAETEEANVMKRPPRNSREPLFDRKTVVLSVLQGISILVITLSIFIISLYREQDEFESRALSFTTLVLANLGLILANRSWSRTILSILRLPNVAFRWVAGGAIAFLGLVLYFPFLRDLFRFSALHPIDLAISLAAALLGVTWLEVFKLINRRRI